MLRIPPVRVSRAVRAEAGAVWELLVRPEDWPRWGISVTAVECADARISLGSQGRVRTPLGLWLPFQVTRFEEGRSWAWTVSGVPATSHAVARHAVGCRASFEVPSLLWPYLLICRDALRRIAVLAEDPRRAPQT